MELEEPAKWAGKRRRQKSLDDVHREIVLVAKNS